MDPNKLQRIPLETTDTSPAPPPATAAASEAAAAPSAPVLKPEEVQAIQENVIAALRGCYDPEIPVNIFELGLIYNIDVAATGAVGIQMTLTSPACPVAGSLPPEVQRKVRDVPGVTAAKVDVVWDPPWTPDRMSEAAKLQLGIF